MISWARVLVVVLATLLSARVEADVQYAYDAAGRLVHVVAPDGTSAAYEYDAAGNILSIQRIAAGQLFLASFSPLSGPPGTQVTIRGSGFSTTPASNTVTFNGAAAVVASSTANELIVHVPVAASTGQIAITVASITVTSKESFVVYTPPAISGFSPAIVSVAATVTISGTNLEPIAGPTQVAVGVAAAQTLSASSTQLSIRAPAASGHIVVTTAYGTATTAVPLIVAPGTIGAANIVASAFITGGGASQSLSINQQNKYGVFAFDGTQGQLLSVQIDSLTATPSNANVAYQVFSPSNAVVASGTISTSNMSIHLPPLPSAGTYLVTFASGGATAQINATLEINPQFNVSGGSLTGVSTTASGQTKRFWISATAGESIGVGLKNLVMSPSSVGSIALTLHQPNGTYIWGRNCNTADPAASCGLPFPDLTQTGNHLLTAVPNGAAQMTFDLTISGAVTGTLTPGTPYNVNLPLSGQFANLTFTASAGQTVALNLASIVTAPANVNLYLSVKGPNGAAITNLSTTTGTTLNFTNLAAGTHQVLVAPYFGATATAQLTLSPGLTATVPSNGSTSSTFSTGVPGQNGYFTIPATAGQHIGIALRNLVTTPGAGSINLTVYQPNGAHLGSRTCATWDPVSSCGIQFLDLPQTGDYLLVAVPSASQRMNFDLTVSQAITGSFTPGTPINVNLAAPGQFVYLSFTATAGQTFALNLGSIVTTPSNVNMYLAVNGPNGANITNLTTKTGTTLNLPNLAAGTYKVFLVPYFGITATAQLTLAPGVTATVNMDASTSSFSTTVPGQNAYFTIAATALQDIGIGLTNLVTAAGSIQLTLYRPDGGYIWGRPCFVSDPVSSCGLPFIDLPTTGNYKLVAAPSGSATMSFDLTVSEALSTTLASGTPQTVTMPLPGQFVGASFTAASGQSATVNVSSITTIPANVMLYVTVYGPNGIPITNQSSASGMTFNLPNLTAGTYTVYVVTYYAVTGSAQLSLTLQ